MDRKEALGEHRSRPLPRLLLEPLEVAAAVQDGSDQDALGFDAIDDAVGLDQQFLDVRLVRFFRDAAAELGKVGERLGGADELRDGAFGVELGILGDVVVERLKFLERARGPVDLHETRKRFLTSSCETTRPSSPSRSPSAVFWRT